MKIAAAAEQQQVSNFLDCARYSQGQKMICDQNDLGQD